MDVHKRGKEREKVSKKERERERERKKEKEREREIKKNILFLFYLSKENLPIPKHEILAGLHPTKMNQTCLTSLT